MFKAHRVIEAAAQHGQDSDPDHEVGDLQEALRAALEIMNRDQIKRWAADERVQAVLEAGGDAYAADLEEAQANASEAEADNDTRRR